MAQTFVDVHKLALRNENVHKRRGDGSWKRGGGFGRGGHVGSFGGSAGDKATSVSTPQVNTSQLDFSYIDQNSVNALGIGPISADTLRKMADAGQIWMYDPGADYKFIVTWAPGWNTERYKRYGGAGASSSPTMSSAIIDQAMERKQAGNDSQALIGRMMAEDHGGMLSVEQYHTLPDFDYYAQIGANIQNPTYNDALGYAYIFGWRPGSEKVGNIVTYSRDNWEEIAYDEVEQFPTVGRSLYRYMTQDEVDVYNYLLAKEGAGAAQEFLDALEETLNYRFGTEIAERVRGIDNDAGRTLATGVYAVSAGVDEWGSGVRQLFSEERLPTSPTQFGSAYVRNDLQQDENGLGLFAYDATTTLSNMTPSILTSFLLTPGAGAVVQGASAAGNAYNQALADGYSTEQAATYGTLIGVSEGTLQYLLGGISKLGGVSSKQLLTKLEGVENGLMRAAAALGIKGLSEITEEELQLVLEPLYRSIVFGEEYDAPTVEEFVYTALITFVTTGVMEAGNIAAYARNRPVQPTAWEPAWQDWGSDNDFSIASEADATAGSYAADARDKLTDINHRDIIRIQNGFARFPDGDPLNSNAKMVTPLDDYFDVAMHGTQTAVGFGSEDPNMSPRLLAAMILHNENYSGQSIRLLSCSTGKAIDGDYCFAEELANILGVNVYAPNDTLYIFPNGKVLVGDDGSGEFVLYKPNQRRRFK